MYLDFELIMNIFIGGPRRTAAQAHAAYLKYKTGQGNPEVVRMSESEAISYETFLEDAFGAVKSAEVATYIKTAKEGVYWKTREFHVSLTDLEAFKASASNDIERAIAQRCIREALDEE